MRLMKRSPKRSRVFSTRRISIRSLPMPTIIRPRCPVRRALRPSGSALSARRPSASDAPAALSLPVWFRHGGHVARAVLVGAASAVHPHRLTHHRLLAKTGDDAVEVLQVPHFKVDLDLGEVAAAAE